MSTMVGESFSLYQNARLLRQPEIYMICGRADKAVGICGFSFKASAWSTKTPKPANTNKVAG